MASVARLAAKAAETVAVVVAATKAAVMAHKLKSARPAKADAEAKAATNRVKTKSVPPVANVPTAQRVTEPLAKAVATSVGKTAKSSASTPLLS